MPNSNEVVRLRKLATADDAEACFQVGEALEATGEPGDREEALLWFALAAFMRHPAAHFHVARRCREWGNADLAQDHLNAAARGGHAGTLETDPERVTRSEPEEINSLRNDSSASKAGDCLDFGEALLTLDMHSAKIEAIVWFLQAARLGEVRGNYHLGRYFAECGQRKLAECHTIFAAKRGYEQAVSFLRALRGGRDEPEEIFNLRQRAEHGDGTACYQLAEALLGGDSPDEAQARHWYEEAARLRDPNGLYRMALFYREEGGQGGAASCLDDAADLGQEQAAKLRNDWKIEGYLDFDDDEEAIRLLDAGAGEGSNIARFRLAKRLLEGRGIDPDPGRACELYLAAAENGHSPSMYELACCYQHGRGVAANRELAVEWMRSAAAGGDPDGLSGLGLEHRDAGNLREAMECFTRAAEMGHAGALFALAETLGRGEAIPANEERIHTLLAQAADKNHAEAQFLLAGYYERGAAGLEKNMARAVEWYERAADQDHVGALRWLAEHVLSSKPAKRDAIRAWTRIERAAKLGDVDSMIRVAGWYDRAKGENNAYLALHWYRQAADKGDAGAQFIAATRMLDAPYEKEAVRRYLESAAAQGHAEAQALLDKVGREPEPEPVDVDGIISAAVGGDPASQFSLVMWYYVGHGVDRNCPLSYFWAKVLKRSNHEQADDAIAMTAAEVPAKIRKKLDQLAQDWKPGDPAPPMPSELAK